VDIASILGPIMALGMIVAGMFAKGAGNLLIQLVNVSAFLIVVGGTFGCLMVAYPMKDYIKSFKALGIFLKNGQTDPNALKTEIIEMAQIARKESILALEKRVDTISYTPLKNAIRMAVDGTDPNIVRDSLETEQHHVFEESEVAVKYWEDFGAISPTIGILGAVIGLMKVMTVLDQPEKIGPGIATAFVATIYGVGLANILAIPIGKKLKRKAVLDGHLRSMVIIGVESILSGLNPQVIGKKLDIFTDGHDDKAA
jgi:chemotaxis protein MotA